MATRTFEGHVRAARLPGGRGSAHIELLPTLLRARTVGGQIFEVPYDGMQLSAGSAAALACADAAAAVTITCAQRGFIYALTQVAGNHVQQQLAPHRRRLSQRTWVQVAALTAALAVALALLWRVPALLRRSLGAVARSLPEGIDGPIGLAAWEHEAQGRPAVLDGGLLQHLQAATQPLLVAFGEPVVLHVLAAPGADAFALPGGHVVLQAGMLRALGSADELAAVVAHELGHVRLRHGLRNLAQAAGAVTTLRLGLGEGLGALERSQRAALGRDLLAAPDAADELAADRAAGRLLAAAGATPATLARLLRRLQGSGAALPWLAAGDTAARLRQLEALSVAAPSGASSAGGAATTATARAASWAACRARLDAVIGGI